MSTPLLPGDLDPEPHDITSLRYRYAIARALHRGQGWQPDQPRRPSLPSELVLYIFRLADLPRCDPSKALYLPWLQENCTVEGEERTYDNFFAWGPEIRSRPWCATPPLSEAYLEQIHKFRLRTLSKDQGVAGDREEGNNGWFEIGILQRLAANEANVPSPEEAERTEVNVGSDAWGLSHRVSDWGAEAELNPSTGKPLRWRSHSNEAVGLEFKLHTGNDIGPEHEIWRHLRPGDRLGVWVNAQSSGRLCYGKYANIEVWKRWHPSWM
ncbi:hypothetical protein FRB95_005707 [Tulasnella sp. JGI-2019a]|nr:hypothetical protein FRB95_005707 [Tulasnella sp. JGI-2019a]